MAPERLLRLPQVLELVPVGKTKWWEMVRDGIAPASVKIGPRITMWRESEVQQFINRITSQEVAHA